MKYTKLIASQIMIAVGKNRQKEHHDDDEHAWLKKIEEHFDTDANDHIKGKMGETDGYGYGFILDEAIPPKVFFAVGHELDLTNNDHPDDPRSSARTVEKGIRRYTMTKDDEHITVCYTLDNKNDVHIITVEARETPDEMKDE